MRRASGAGAGAALRRRTARSGSSARGTSCAPTPAAAGSPRTRPASSASPRRSGARRCGAWRRTPCCPAARARASASRCSARRCSHGRACTRGDALGVVGHQGGAGLPPGRASSCTRRCTSPAPSTGRAPGRREGPRGQRVRHRPDGLPRPGAPAAPAHGPDHELMLRHLAAAGLRHDHRVGLRLPQRARPAGAARGLNRRTATRLLWAALADGPEQVDASTTSPAPTSGRSTSGFAARLELHQEGYLGLRGMKPPAPYVHNGALL